MTTDSDLRLPSKDESSQAQVASQAVAKLLERETGESIRLSNGISGETFDVPHAAAKLLLRILSEMASGNAITLMPVDAELTTQETADLLNVSRPHVIKLLKEEKIEYHFVGTHRRIYASDVLEYKRQRDSEQNDALNELTQIAVAEELGY